MGILNITPDSFSDGGKWFETEKAIEKAFEIENAGVKIAYVKAADETIVKVISNGMVDISCYVDFDAEAECDIKENVRFDVLCEILDFLHLISFDVT